MHPEQMRELISESTADKLILIIALLSPVIGLAFGAIWGMFKRKLFWGLCNGLLIGMLGVLNLILWRFHKYRMRFDPATGYAGLHRVDVLLENLLVFILVGIAVGVAAGLYVRRFGKYWQGEQSKTEGVD
ncbi:MAG: hypothetical protein RMK18_11185 [Armatimonadota bacterium]|nr:hypothetical protein [Armatimonadota bacterium]MCX7778337.1 hypothetical protein [Armatimonadota bacterium]MDW8026411.1 hypothetical protein [Armatimonadota bacterium]